MEDQIGLSVDLENPILWISDSGISPIVLFARSLARTVFLFRVFAVSHAVIQLGSRRNALSWQAIHPVRGRVLKPIF